MMICMTRETDRATLFVDAHQAVKEDERSLVESQSADGYGNQQNEGNQWIEQEDVQQRDAPPRASATR